MKDAETSLKRLRDQYLRSIRDAEYAISNYEQKKKAGEPSRGAYRERLFHSVNAKIAETEERAKNCEQAVVQINSFMRDF